MLKVADATFQLSPTSVVTRRCTRAMPLVSPRTRTIRRVRRACPIYPYSIILAMDLHEFVTLTHHRPGLFVTNPLKNCLPSLAVPFNQIDISVQSNYHHCLMYPSIRTWTVRSQMPVRARRLTATDRNLFLCATPVLLDVISTRLGRTLRGVPDLHTLITTVPFRWHHLYSTDDESLSRAGAMSTRCIFVSIIDVLSLLIPTDCWFFTFHELPTGLR